MGISIHFELQAKTRSQNKSRQIVERIRQRALDLAFDWVSDVFELTGPDCDPSTYDPDDDLHGVPVRCLKTILVGDRDINIPANHIIFFLGSPGLGCESLHLGLATYPAAVYSRGKMIRTGLKGWYWSSDCETHYASHEESGGIHNFVRCHRTVVSVLDYANDLGVLRAAYDLGGYWETRDIKYLAGSIEAWDRKIDSLIDDLDNMKP